MKMNHSLPSRMQAVQLNEPNGCLTLRKIPLPRPQAGQVLIRMAAAPINPLDLNALTSFSYSGERQFPFTPGLEGSGTVVEAGEGIMCFPLAAAQKGLATYVSHMSAGKILFVANPQEVTLDA